MPVDPVCVGELVESMATRFVRVTVVGDQRQLDVSLPSARPLFDLVPSLCHMLSMPPPTHKGSWLVSTVAGGVLDSRRTLAEAGVVDADVLYLSPPQEAPPPPFVDDVVDEVQTTLDNDGSEWNVSTRAAGCSALAALGVLGLIWFAQIRLDTGPRLSVLLDIAVTSVGVAGLLRHRGGLFFALAAGPSWILAGDAVASLGSSSGLLRTFDMVVGLGVALLSMRIVGAQWRPVAATGAVVALLGAVAAAMNPWLPDDRAAALLVVPALFSVGLAPQLAVGRAGVVDLLRAQEAGVAVNRAQVRDAVGTGQAVLTGVVAGACAVAALAASALVLFGGPFAAELGLATAVIFGLRARAFTRTGQVLPMLVVPTVVVVVVGFRLPDWLSLTPTTVWTGAWLAIVVAVLAGLGAIRLGEVAAARLDRVADIVEGVAVIAVIPLVLATLGAFDWVGALVS